MFNQFVQVDDGNKEWRNFRKFFISLGVKLKFDFSEDAKTFKIPYKDKIDDFASQLGFGEQVEKLKIPQLSEVLPMVFARVLDFEPTIHEVKIFSEDQDMFGE